MPVILMVLKDRIEMIRKMAVGNILLRYRCLSSDFLI
jgi:hypothetical protein